MSIEIESNISAPQQKHSEVVVTLHRATCPVRHSTAANCCFLYNLALDSH